MELEKKPFDIEQTLKNFTEARDPDPNAKGYPLGTKNQARIEKIRELAKKVKGQSNG